jgi:alkanesulfonate monooxygenase SsuD/methylene tetrahydromethanopterin reductase-like flavin-dependent oxidoreductase (luciferase family)
VSIDLAINVQGQEGVTWSDWLALAAACEEHGVPTLSRSDHYEGFSPAAADGALDAWGTICGLAAVTERLRLATLVSPVTFRHPAVLAKLATTADHISGGRIDVGIGAGWAEREHATYGFDFPPLGQRMLLLERQLEVLRTHWTSGDHLPPPAQAPNPPIILGGNAKPRSIALAARYADEYNVGGIDAAAAADVRGWLDAACAATGRRVRLSVMTGILVGPDQDEVERRAQALRQASGGRAPGPTAIVGTPAAAVARLREYAEAGVDRVMLGHGNHRDLETVRIIGREVLPPLADAHQPSTTTRAPGYNPRSGDSWSRGAP